MPESTDGLLTLVIVTLAGGAALAALIRVRRVRQASHIAAAAKSLDTPPPVEQRLDALARQLIQIREEFERERKIKAVIEAELKSGLATPAATQPPVANPQP